MALQSSTVPYQPSVARRLPSPQLVRHLPRLAVCRSWPIPGSVPFSSYSIARR
ncbi:unnamed protein product [Cuscuta epithymum]|uniref:Uncharacterized protein n=1 Tax=Cuscuta epithymum TaxID=186058 RepID=A0AAV0ES26_9ASTE|nr:unnamed protein product [Cuscuta epithymum]